MKHDNLFYSFGLSSLERPWALLTTYPASSSSCYRMTKRRSARSRLRVGALESDAIAVTGADKIPRHV